MSLENLGLLPYLLGSPLLVLLRVPVEGGVIVWEEPLELVRILIYRSWG